MADQGDLRHSFYLLQILLGIVSVAAAWIVFRGSQPKTGFKLREADRKRSSRRAAASEKEGPRLLTGLRIDGAPHEILGVRPDADEGEIQDAYLALIKRFHPDRVGRAGSREWQDAQKIASALNEARRQMLERTSKR